MGARFGLSPFDLKLAAAPEPSFEERLVVFSPSSSLPPLPAPIFFGLTLHCWRRRVLHLEPVVRTAGPVARAEALRDDALQPELAGVAEHDVALLGDVLVELETDLGKPTQQLA